MINFINMTALLFRFIERAFAALEFYFSKHSIGEIAGGAIIQLITSQYFIEPAMVSLIILALSQQLKKYIIAPIQTGAQLLRKKFNLESVDVESYSTSVN